MKFNKQLVFELSKGLLADDGMNGIRWPDHTIQRNYTGADGNALLQRTIDFIEVLVTCAPIIESDLWSGLDYGVGFGRIASVLSTFGSPSQLTCVDAWEKSLSLAKSVGLKNPAYVVDSCLSKTSLPHEKFDFAYAYSIFTHLPRELLLNNIQRVVQSLRPGGVFVFTIREPRFLNFLERNGKCKPAVDELAESGYWFGNQQSESYGDTILDFNWIEKNLARFGRIENMGVCQSEPFQLIVALYPFYSIETSSLGILEK